MEITLKIYLLVVVVTSFNAYAVTTTSSIALTGSLSNINTCSVGIDNQAFNAAPFSVSSVVPAGGYIKDVDGDDWKIFNITVSCSLNTSIYLTYSSSLATSSHSEAIGDYLTDQNKPAAYVFIAIGSTYLPTVDGVGQNHGAIGNTNLGDFSASSSFSPIGNTNVYATNVTSNQAHVFTVLNSSSTPSIGKIFVVPFRMGLWTYATSNNWLDDMAGKTISLTSTVTIELHSI